jgi:hypothetical protein
MEKSDIRSLFRSIDSNQDSLTRYQLELINGLRRYYRRNKTLTDRQKEVLLSIAGQLSSVSK